MKNYLIRVNDFSLNGVHMKLFYCDVANYFTLPHGVGKGSFQFNQLLPRFVTDWNLRTQYMLLLFILETMDSSASEG